MELDFRGCLHLLVDVVLKLGREEVEGAQVDRKTAILLRVLTPLLKLYAGKMSVRVTSEAIECLGGTG